MASMSSPSELLHIGHLDKLVIIAIAFYTHNDQLNGEPLFARPSSFAAI